MMAGEQANRSVQTTRPSLTLINGRRELSYDQFESFVGISSHINDLKEFIGVQATHSQPVLLIGERGLRQEQVARILHQAGEHWGSPFFAVNAHGLGPEALDSLLFGSQGMIETVREGTIYINELTSLPALLQQRFAVHLEEQRWRQPGGRPNSQRLVFASAINPGERSAENRIAYGLVEMLKPFSFSLKPLRERNEDIQYLVRHLTARISQRLGRGPHEISREALTALVDYNWPGNIDELETVIASAIESLPPKQIDEQALPSRIRFARLQSIPPAGIDLPSIVDDFERQLISTALAQTGGSQTRASKLLGLRVQTLNMKLKRYTEQDRPLL